MQASNAKEFAALWTGVCEIYGKAPSDVVIVMAFNALAKYDMADIKRALSAHVADPINGRFAPKPADLILHMDGDPDSRALQAWTKAADAISSVGPYKSVVFDDAALMTAIEDMGGWVEFCSVSDTELPYKSAEFVKRYKGYLNRPSIAHPPKLIGIMESQNGAKYAHLNDPVLIGNPQAALALMQTGSTKQGGLVSLSALLDKMPNNGEGKPNALLERLTDTTWAE